MRRSSWARWLGMGMLVATSKANDSDGGPRASRERARERGRGRMRCPRGRGGDVEIIQVSRGVGGKQVASWRARALRRHLCACLVRKKQLAGMGQHSAGPARWVAAR